VSGARAASPGPVAAALAAVLGLATLGVPVASRASSDGPGPCADASATADAPRRAAAGGVELAWRPRPAPIAVGRPFAVEIEVCGRPAGVPPRVARVDAWMPEHRHGMNYRTTIVGAPPGVVRAEGLLWHMPGRWRLVVDLRDGERTVRVTDEVTLR